LDTGAEHVYGSMLSQNAKKHEKKCRRRVAKNQFGVSTGFREIQANNRAAVHGGEKGEGRKKRPGKNAEKRGAIRTVREMSVR